MINKDRVASLIYNCLKFHLINDVLETIELELRKEKTDKLKITKTPLLNSI